MDTLTRRRFLQMSGAGAIAAVAASFSFEDIAQAGRIKPLPAGTPILVIVTLYGGNDGLNTVVPYLDPIYQSSRPGISIGASGVLDIGDGLGLNSSMTGFKSLWDQKKLAIVRGVGYPFPDFSHFTSMSIWQTGSPKDHLSSGWIGRWLDSQPHDPMNAIGLGSVLPPLLAGVREVGSVLPLGGLVIPTGAFGIECQKLSLRSFSDNPLTAVAAKSMSDLFKLSATVTPILKGPAPVPDDPIIPSGSNLGGDTSLSQQLDVVAKLITANAPTRVWAVSLGGFDTHADEVNSQTSLLATVSNSISRFLSQMHATGRADDVVVMVYSEFGRRVHANASQGTDHGTAGPVFLAGNRIKGGFYGDQPSLNKLVGGDLAVTTDFRDVYSSMLQDVLKTDSSKVIPGWSTKLEVVKSAIS
jgi:uncharacterized protein (DUF1501 family)